MRRKTLLVALFFYLVLSLVYTYPLIFNLSDKTYGYSGDNLGSIHYFWWWKESFFKGQDVRDSYLEEAPFGVTIDREPGTIFFYLPVKALSLISDPVTSYNLVLILGFPLAAFSMYLLVQYLVSKPPISFLAGFIFSFSPYHFWKAYNHLDLALIWTLPLFLLSFFYWEKVLERGRTKEIIRASLWVALAQSATLLTNFYYGYFLFLLFGFLLLTNFLFLLLKKRLYFDRVRILSLTLIALLVLLFTMPFMAHVFLDAVRPSQSSQSFLRKDSYDRPLLNLVSLSARPWDYLLPSSDHPFLGKITAQIYQWLRSRGNDFKTVSAPVHERTIYLGVINIFLFFTSVFMILKSRSFRQKYGKLTVTLMAAIFFLFLISLPPYFFLKGYTIYLPSFFLYKVFPMFRTYSRLGIIILMLATVISSIVLNYLTQILSRRRNLLLTSYFLLLALAFFDFLNIPSFKVIDLTTPPSYLWLSKQPGNFSVIEYPQDFNVAESLFFQRIHQKGVLNFHSQSAYFGLWEALAYFQLPRTARILEALGVRFALFHKSLLFPEENPVDDLWYKRAFEKVPDYKNLPGFSLAQDFPETAILKVEQSENPASLVILSENSGGIKEDSFPKNDWVWSGKWNNLYLVNLISVKEVVVTINLSIDQNDLGMINSVRFNGDPVKISEEGKIDLIVKNKINELKFEKSDPGFVNFGKVKVSFVVIESGKVSEKVL